MVIRASIAKCVRSALDDMTKAYAHYDYDRFSGAYKGMIAFAENFYADMYGSLDDKEDFEKFLRECKIRE
jgi:hypothetical protein